MDKGSQSLLHSAPCFSFSDPHPGAWERDAPGQLWARHGTG